MSLFVIEIELRRNYTIFPFLSLLRQDLAVSAAHTGLELGSSLAGL